MSVPEKYLAIKNKFAEAFRTGNFAPIATIPLDDLKLAKIHLSAESSLPYYSLLLQTLTEREKYTAETPEGIKVAGVETNYAKNQHIFLAHRLVEEILVEKLKKMIERNKYFWVEAKKTDVGKISSEVLGKIRKSGFFIAVMTGQHELKDGNFTANTWLLEQKAAALAFGQRPFVLMEERVERHYAGFVQTDEQIISFNRITFDSKAEAIIKRIDEIYKKSFSQGLI